MSWKAFSVSFSVSLLVAVERHQLAVQADDRRRADFDVKV